MLEHSGLKRISLAYRCGGSAGLITEVTHRLPVSPPARRQEAPGTGRMGTSAPFPVKPWTIWI